MLFLSSVSFPSIQRFVKENAEDVIIGCTDVALVTYTGDFKAGLYGAIGYTIAKTIEVVKNRFFNNSSPQENPALNLESSEQPINRQLTPRKGQRGSRASRFLKNHFKEIAITGLLAPLLAYDFKMTSCGALGYAVERIIDVAKSKFSSLFSFYQENVQLQQELQLCRNENVNLRAANADLVKKNSRQEKEILLQRGVVKGFELEKRVSGAQEYILTLEHTIDELKNKLQRFQDSYKSRGRIEDDLKDNLKKLEQQNKTLKNKITRLEKDKSELDEKLKKQELWLFKPVVSADQQENFTNLQNKLLDYQRQNTALENEKSNLEDEKSKLINEKSELEDEINGLREGMSRLNVLIEGYRKGFNNRALKRNVGALTELKNILLKLHPEIRDEEEVGRTLNPVEQVDAKAAASAIRREFKDLFQEIQDSSDEVQNLVERIASAVNIIDESENKAECSVSPISELSDSDEELS